MIKSMTAFARSQLTEDFGVLTCELRTVNHRYLDISFRLPEDLRALETRYRELISAKLNRGKIECNLRYKSNTMVDGNIEVNNDLAKSLVNACQKVNNILHQPSDINAIEILKWPGVVQEKEKDLKPVHDASENCLKIALDELISNRESEGQRLKDMIVQRCDAVEDVVAQVRTAMPEIQLAQREKVLAKIQELTEQPDMERFEQELTYLAVKMDVDEELDRLQSHLTEIREVLQRNEAVGRRLDFLMQEFNREANTLGSKSADMRMTQASVELKVLIEQMREQIQNIE